MLWRGRRMTMNSATHAFELTIDDRVFEKLTPDSALRTVRSLVDPTSWGVEVLLVEARPTQTFIERLLGDRRAFLPESGAYLSQESAGSFTLWFVDGAGSEWRIPRPLSFPEAHGLLCGYVESGVRPHRDDYVHAG